MTTQYTQTAATISTDITFFLLADEIDKSDISKPAWQNTEILPEFDSTAGIIIKSTRTILGQGEQLAISQPSVYGKSTLSELNFEEEFSDTQQQDSIFPTYREYFIFPTYPEQDMGIIVFADEDVLDLMQSRAVEQEVLDLLDEPISR